MASVQKILHELREVAQKSIRVTGPTEIGGEVTVQGSKNAANKLVAATVALPGKYEIHNFPIILDPLEMLALIDFLGGTVELDEKHNIARIDTRAIANKLVPYSLTKSTTSSFGFAGALLGRFGNVQIGKPGGDAIGPRPVDLHVDGFKALGASISEQAEALSGELMTIPDGQTFKMRMPSTGAAVNYILAVAASRGKARLQNAPQCDGDMEAMYGLLRCAGVTVGEKGGEVVVDAQNVHPVAETIRFDCSLDRNDAFTWLTYGTLSTKGLRIHKVPVKDVKNGMDVLTSLGAIITYEDDDTVMVKAPPSASHRWQDATIVAGLATEFHSDWAPIIEVFLTTLQGKYRVIDTLFEKRVLQAELLQKMTADIRISGGKPPKNVELHFRTHPDDAQYIVDISGPATLEAIATPVGYDVRACAAMVMAASQAMGESKLSEMRAFYRGYEKIIERLQAVGVDISVEESRT